MYNREALKCPPPRQDEDVTKGYRFLKILGYYGTKALGCILKKNFFLPYLGKDKRMGYNQYPPQPFLIREGASRYCEGATQSQDISKTNRPSPLPSPIGEGVKCVGREIKGEGEEIRYSRFTLHPSLKKRPAFTLAEVLITLGIIGVVAAMTIPSLIADYQKKQTVNQLRKVYADLNNAVKLSEVDNGPASEWNYPTQTCYAYNCIAPFVEQYYLPYFQGAKIVKTSDMPDYIMFEYDGYRFPGMHIYLILNNGVIISFFSNTPSGYIWLFADINGKKGPNKIGRDVFVFDAYNWIQQGYKIKFWGLGFDKDNFNDASIQYGCNRENDADYKNFYCGALIEASGWEIPENYPW